MMSREIPSGVVTDALFIAQHPINDEFHQGVLSVWFFHQEL